MKHLASGIGIDTYERLSAYSILRREFSAIEAVPIFPKREDLWAQCMTKLVSPNEPVTYVEFGVHAGYSIKFIAALNTHADSRFIGLDSFEGLPEDWGSMPKGTFNTQGNIPHSEDARISFIKGWFQRTWSELAERLKNAHTLVVHYDADLYSSTLFALSQIDGLKKDYFAIFDEFMGHEARALYNYRQAYNASLTFLGKTIWPAPYPTQVLCNIRPEKASR